MNVGQWAAFQGLQTDSELPPARPSQNLDPARFSDLPAASPNSLAQSHATAEGCLYLQHVVCLLLNAEPPKQHWQPEEEGMEMGATSTQTGHSLRLSCAQEITHLAMPIT